MIDQDPIEEMFHSFELTGHVLTTSDDRVRVIVENSDPSQLGGFLEELTNHYYIDVSHDDHSIYILVRATHDSP